MSKRTNNKFRMMVSSLSIVSLLLIGSTTSFVFYVKKHKYHNPDAPLIIPTWTPLTPESFIKPNGLTPATSIFASSELILPVSNALTNKLPIGSHWTLAPGISVTNIHTNTLLIQGQPITTTTANIYGIVTVGGVDKKFSAIVTYSLNDQSYSITNLKTDWAMSSNLTPVKWPKWDGLSPVKWPKWDGLSPVKWPKWDGLSPVKWPKQDELTPAMPTQKDLTPATSIFANNNLIVPVSNALTNKLPIGSHWTLAPGISVTNIHTNTLLIQGQPITTTTANIYGIVTVGGVDKKFSAIVTYSLNDQSYLITNLKTDWAMSSNLTPVKWPKWDGLSPVKWPKWDGLSPVKWPKWDGLSPVKWPKWDGLSPVKWPKWDELTPAMSDILPGFKPFIKVNLHPITVIAMSKKLNETIAASDLKITGINRSELYFDPIKKTTTAPVKGYVILNGKTYKFVMQVTYLFETDTYATSNVIITIPSSSYNNNVAQDIFPKNILEQQIKLWLSKKEHSSINEISRFKISKINKITITNNIAEVRVDGNCWMRMSWGGFAYPYFHSRIRYNLNTNKFSYVM